jgi:hypothetical protein
MFLVPRWNVYRERHARLTVCVVARWDVLVGFAICAPFPAHAHLTVCATPRWRDVSAPQAFASTTVVPTPAAQAPTVIPNANASPQILTALHNNTASTSPAAHPPVLQPSDVAFLAVFATLTAPEDVCAWAPPICSTTVLILSALHPRSQALPELFVFQTLQHQPASLASASQTKAAPHVVTAQPHAPVPLTVPLPHLCAISSRSHVPSRATHKLHVAALSRSGAAHVNPLPSSADGDTSPPSFRTAVYNPVFFRAQPLPQFYSEIILCVLASTPNIPFVTLAVLAAMS